MKAKHQRRKFQLKKGLTRTAAYKAVSKRARGDFRGMTYNEKTGACVIV